MPARHCPPPATPIAPAADPQHALALDRFHFVSVNPTSERQKSHNRSVIRSHASRYIWRQHRARRTPNPAAKPPAARLQPSSPPAPPPRPPSTTTNPTASSSSSSPPPQPLPSPPSPSTDNDRDDYDAASQLVPQAAAAAAADRPFNLLTAWLADPSHAAPSMLGESAISKLMQYAVLDLWPGLVLGAANRRWHRKDAAQNWLPPAMSSPALFTAFLYGAAGHMQTRKRLESAHVAPQTRDEKLEQIVCETETIKQLNKMMHHPSQACSDEVILAVLCMAFNRIDYSGWNVADPWPKAPLRNLQWLDVYGGLSLNDHHIKGLLALIETKGGLDQLKMPGLAEILSTAVVMLSTKCLVKPRLPFVPIFAESAQGKTPHWPTLTNPVLFGTPLDSRPVDPVLNAGLPEDIVSVLQQMRDYNHVVNVYSQGLLPQLELAVIADRRNWIQYNLVALSSVWELPEQFMQIYETYETCRLAAQIYSMLVIFPLPAANRPFKRLASMVRAAFLESEHSMAWNSGKEMLLWCLVLGTMAAKNTSDRSWFCRKLASALDAVGPGSWQELKGHLASVMWMDSVCDIGGREAWLEATTTSSIHDDSE
ncbi:hypothetical protein LOZ02_004934 [Ophidiomyces ophidiicola]|nr:hypothetical protein LOZ02_004934 [Ophidiomyces ophidiicola]